MSRPAGAILRFHLGAGVRLALRSSAPIVVPFLAIVGTSDDPPATLTALASSLVSTKAEPMSLAGFAAIALGLASWAAPRLAPSASGWIRHLPAGEASHRRAALLALVVAQSPLLALALILTAGLLLNGGAPSPIRLAALPLMTAATALLGLGAGRRWLLVPAGVASLLLAMSDRWGALAGAGILIAAGERLAGPLEIARPRLRGGGARGAWVDLVVSWRALGARTASAFAPSLLVLGLCALFVSNNPLSGAQRAAAARLGGLLAATWLIAALARDLSARRPPWPWARSLPASSTARILADAGFFALHAAPLVLLAALLEPWAMLPALASLPLVAIRAARAMRSGAADRIGAYGRVLLEGLALASLVALVPWAAALALAAAAPAAREAARLDREMKVTRWVELHHLVRGDPLSWSA